MNPNSSITLAACLLAPIALAGCETIPLAERCAQQGIYDEANCMQWAQVQRQRSQFMMEQGLRLMFPPRPVIAPRPSLNCGPPDSYGRLNCY